ncbi:MAG: DUF4214 domain-containing protein [Clostridiales bacterium]|nr:DUF4214 domain-containing protein [Clostridiales bacterium]
MRIKRSFLGLILAVIMLMQCQLFLGNDLRADTTLPDINASLSADGALTWEPVGSGSGIIYIVYLNNTVIKSTKGAPYSVNVKEYCDNNQLSSSINYSVRIYSYYLDSNGETYNTTNYASNGKTFVYNYVSPYKTMNFSPNYVWDDTNQLLKWDKPDCGSSEVTYLVSIRSLESATGSVYGSSNYSHTYKINTNSLPYSSIVSKTHDDNKPYFVDITAYADGYQKKLADRSDAHCIKLVDIKDNIQNIRINNGTVEWDPYPGADKYQIKLIDNNKISYTLAYKDNCSCDLYLYTLDTTTDHHEMTLSIAATKNSAEQDDFQLTAYTPLETTFVYEKYDLLVFGAVTDSLKTGGIDINDIFNDGGSCIYDPKTNTLTFDEPDYSKYLEAYPNYTKDNLFSIRSMQPLFESKSDLIIKGKADLYSGGNIFRSKNGTVTFAEDSDITIESAGTAVYGKSIVMNGKSLNIKTTDHPQKYAYLNNGLSFPLMEAENDIKFGDSCKTVTVETDLEFGLFVSHNGKVILENHEIKVPSNGILGSDSYTIFENDGSTKANKAIIDVKVTPDPIVPAEPSGQSTTDPTTTVPTEDNSNGGGFEDFVERLYVVALNRPSEKEGKDYWCELVGNGTLTGADCARFFLTSPEFKGRGLSDEDFLKVLYKSFFDRDAANDPDGFNFWMNSLKSVGKDTVVEGFINSPEWCDICAEYGVKSGAPTAKATRASKNATAFATRLYTECLGREPEEGGLKFWALSLTNLEVTGADTANLFFESDEFKGFNTTNEEYIKRLYTTFMGRDYDDAGLSYWLGEMNNGLSRHNVLVGFSNSKEFTEICASYGINRGDIA